MEITDAPRPPTPEGADMPSTSISTPESTPSVDRLTLGVGTTREGATTSTPPFLFGCSASSED